MKVAVVALLVLFVTTAAGQEPTFTSSDVADAAERITGKRAHMSGEIRLLAGTRLVGPAITMRAVRDDKASSAEEGLKAIRVLETAAPGSVVILVLDGPEKDFAVFGATFATLAKSRSLAGFIVDGSIRGLAEFRRLAFPMFARSTVPGSAGGHFRLEAVNVTVTCGGLEVSPGDLIVGDEDGVAVAPAALVPEVLERASRLRREKDALLPLIKRHGSYTKAVQQRAKTARKAG